MILDEKLQLKVANYKNGELWHPKMYLLEDGDGNKIAASGSGNMSESGFEKNYEIHDIFTNGTLVTSTFHQKILQNQQRKKYFGEFGIIMMKIQR